MKADARHYPPDKNASIDLYEGARLIVERDGPNLVRIEASEGDPQQVFGAPGVSLELTLDDALALMQKLSEVTA
jgi:hypothetical protein